MLTFDLDTENMIAEMVDFTKDEEVAYSAICKLTSLQALEYLVLQAYDGPPQIVVGILLSHPEIFELALMGLNTKAAVEKYSITTENQLPHVAEVLKDGF